MSNYQDIFMRDSLNDPGIIPSTGNPYYSPDIIPHTQVADPNVSFGGNKYNTDLAQNIEYGQYNYIYARCKNLASTAQSGSIKLYWSQTSLVMFPNTWKNQGLSLADGSSSLTINNLSPNTVGVGSQPFVWTPPTDERYGFCMIGQVITTDHPNDIPTGNLTWGTFVTWVRTNPNICWRNLHIVNDLPDPQYDRLHLVSNETPDSSNMTFLTKLINFPIGTTIKQICTSLNINDSVITSESANYLYSGNPAVASGFSGSLEVQIILPSGASWPSDGQVQTTSYVGIDLANDIHELESFADPQEKHPLNLEHLNMLSTGRLVEIGNNTTNFVVNS
jgi:hypothetical protein